MKRFPVFVGLLLFSLAVFPETYRWVDENGVVSYSQTPPPNQPADVLNIKSQSSIDNSAAQQKLDELRQRLANERKQRQEIKVSADKAHQEREIREKNCQAAHSNLRKLEGLGSRMLKTPEGEYIRLTEEQRQERLQAARDQIKLNCSPQNQ